MSIRVGIDLGTTYSAVARINPNTGKPEVIKNKYGKSTTPSVLYFDPSGDLMYGQDAKDMQSLGDGNAVSFFKRNMGNDYFAVEMNGREYTAEDFSAEFLKCIVKEAEAKCGEKIKDAVITVPAYFTHKERESTMRAGEKAGLNVLAIINEPTAAAFAYGLNEVPGEQTVLIYDLGGGTFDVTIARINQDSIQVLGSDGNHELGGKDWDELLCGYLVREYMTRTDLDPTDDFDFMDSMSVLAENTKKKLTDMDSVSVPVNFRGRRENIDVSEELFTEITSYLLEETMDKTNSLLGELGLGWSDLTGTILVGGSTRMKMVHRFIKDKTGREPMGGVNVDEAVALGAAIRANIDENGKEIKSVIAGFLGGGAQAMPVLGAKSIVDATAHALGMIAESVDGERYENSVIIPKNKAIPAEEKKSYSFRTRSKDNEMEVYVLQGSHQRPLDNTILYKYVITDIMPVPGNMTMIEVAYRYTSNGVVEVEAVQKETNKKLPIRIEPVPEDMSWTDGSPKDNVSATYSAPDVEVILAIDLSGSMSGSPLTLAQKAMTDFVDQMDSEMVKIGVMEFSDMVKVSQKPTNNYHSVKSAIKRFTIGSALGYGNAGQPFTETLKILGKNTDAIRYLIVMTDGVWSNSNKAISEAKRCHLEEIQVMALGFGGADKQFLKAIASTDEFADLTKIENLSGSFSKIARAIGDNSTGVRG